MKDEAFCTLLNGVMPEGDQSIDVLFKFMDRTLRDADPEISDGALGNCHGGWFEWLLAITSWNVFVSNPNAGLAILLPNIRQFDVSKLYEDKLRLLIADLKEKVSFASNVSLITSNPDFVIIENSLAREVLTDFEPILELTTHSIKKLEEVYKNFIGKCSYENIEGYIAVKFSVRPDRRLQIPHEGSLMKAIYTHLQTREWITNPKGLKYFAIAEKFNESDFAALKTVATHSITTVSSLPQAAVDGAYEVKTLQQVRDVFSKILVWQPTVF